MSKGKYGPIARIFRYLILPYGRTCGEFSLSLIMSQRPYAAARGALVFALMFSAMVVGASGQALLTGAIASKRSEQREAENSRRLDPGTTGWETEVFSQRAEAQLSLLADWLKRPDGRDLRTLRPLLAEDFVAGRLVPETLTTLFDDGVLQVRRSAAAQGAPGVVRSAVRSHSSSNGIERFAEFVERFGAGGPRKAKFKLFWVRMGEPGDPIWTRQFVALSGPSDEGTREWNGIWTMRWEVDSARPVPIPLGGTTGSSRQAGNSAGTETPRIVEIRVDTFEEVVARALAPGGSFLADCTSSVFEGVASFEQQLSYGTDYWMQRMEKRFPVYYFGHQGMSLGDVNGDELEDLYVCQPGGLPNRLYLQNEDGSVRDVSPQAGVDLLDYTRSALLIDIDNDGDQDLVVGTLYSLLLFGNDGGGVFTLRESIAEADAALSLAAADYDEDGDLDLYVCRYYSTRSQEGEFVVPLPFYDANNGGSNRLLRNDGDWQFTDATEEAGMDANNKRFTFSAAWEDYDDDGDLDLYVANDFGRNNLYRNDGGQFTDVAREAGVEDIAPGMSVTWGDYNRDGRSDLYVSNMFSAAGNRITFQNRFQPRLDTSDRALFQRHARGNSLFANLGDGTFSETSLASGTTMGRWAWGSLFADLNNDGWDDLLICNGLVTGARLDDL